MPGGSEYSGEVAVAFNPPKGVRPGLAGTVVDGKPETRDVIATIVDLAASDSPPSSSGRSSCFGSPPRSGSSTHIESLPPAYGRRAARHPSPRTRSSSVSLCIVLTLT